MKRAFPSRSVFAQVVVVAPPVVGRDVADALTKMEAGDGVKVDRQVNKNTLYVFLSREGKRTGKKFKFSPEIGGYRIWRIM